MIDGKYIYLVIDSTIASPIEAIKYSAARKYEAEHYLKTHSGNTFLEIWRCHKVYDKDACRYELEKVKL